MMIAVCENTAAADASLPVAGTIIITAATAKPNEWQLVVNNNNNNRRRKNGTKRAVEEEQRLLFETRSKSEALFLMGIGGRNVSLIRKHTNVAIYIRDGGAVWMHPKKKGCDTQKAWCMVLSACCGGILRWFVSPTATQEWYAKYSAAAQAAIAERHGCAIELLRSRVGHTCLMLVPHSALLFDRCQCGCATPDEAAISAVRAMLPVAREELLLHTRLAYN
jgi:hypothetical protein